MLFAQQGSYWGFFENKLDSFNLSCPKVPQSVTRETIILTIQMHFKLYRALELFHEHHVNVLWQWMMVYDLTKSVNYQWHILETQPLSIPHLVSKTVPQSVFALHTLTQLAPPSSAWLLLLPWDHEHLSDTQHLFFFVTTCCISQTKDVLSSNCHFCDNNEGRNKSACF